MRIIADTTARKDNRTRAVGYDSDGAESLADS